MVLHNKINKNILKKNLLLSEDKRTTLSFYKYFKIDDPKSYRDSFYKRLFQMQVYGRIYVSFEGINAQVSVLDANHDVFENYIKHESMIGNVRLNKAIDDDGKSFYKLKILVRKKIVSDGLNDSSFDVTNSGIHLSAKEFNQITEKPNTVIVDMRNHYESEIGHFQNAICPDVDTFRESLEKVQTLIDDKNKNIVMYCTGGIRCEKASAYYKHKGFHNVYQLDGGIIEYTRQVREEKLNNKFIGKNFVFDERLGERITEDVISHCHQCGEKADSHTNCKNDSCHLLFIQCSECQKKYDGCCSKECKSIYNLPLADQIKLRKGKKNKNQFYRKGRSLNIKFKSDN